MTLRPVDTPESIEQAFNEKDDLVFLRDEGLELLALFKKIQDPQKRILIKDLLRVIAESQSPERT